MNTPRIPIVFLNQMLLSSTFNLYCHSKTNFLLKCQQTLQTNWSFRMGWQRSFLFGSNSRLSCLCCEPHILWCQVAHLLFQKVFVTFCQNLCSTFLKRIHLYIKNRNLPKVMLMVNMLDFHEWSIERLQGNVSLLFVSRSLTLCWICQTGDIANRWD